MLLMTNLITSSWATARHVLRGWFDSTQTEAKTRHEVVSTMAEVDGNCKDEVWKKGSNFELERWVTQFTITAWPSHSREVASCLDLNGLKPQIDSRRLPGTLAPYDLSIQDRWTPDPNLQSSLDDLRSWSARCGVKQGLIKTENRVSQP